MILHRHVTWCNGFNPSPPLCSVGAEESVCSVGRCGKDCWGVESEPVAARDTRLDGEEHTLKVIGCQAVLPKARIAGFCLVFGREDSNL